MQYLNEVKKILAHTLQLGPRAEAFNEHTPLLGSLPELDSIMVVNVLTALEERFDISIDDDEISADTFATLGSLALFVKQKLA